MSVVLRCPAAGHDRGLFAASPGVRCKVSGNVRDAFDSPCCGEYVRCAVWKFEREREWAHKRLAQSSTFLNAATGERVAG